MPITNKTKDKIFVCDVCQRTGVYSQMSGKDGIKKVNTKVKNWFTKELNKIVKNIYQKKTFLKNQKEKIDLPSFIKGYEEFKKDILKIIK